MITLIAAVARHGAIGCKGDLLWHIPHDLRHFKAVTMGAPVIMGRHTWESLPFRPLPGRLNIIITSQKDYHPEPSPAGKTPAVPPVTACSP
ncbi:MAG: dihydrofolate reductase, partial [Muribaculaceae bacterium]|nr:dihydrofolate reductase [Muribaculaceae bacterium]